MKYIFILTGFILSIQGQKIFWTSEFGGNTGNGALVSYDLNNNLTEINTLEGTFLADFDLIKEGLVYDQQDGLSIGSDGYIYGTSHFSGGIQPGKQGVIYKMHPDTLLPRVLHVFGTGMDPNTAVYPDNDTLNNIYNPVMGLKEFPANSLIFYGFCKSGGAFQKGGVFKWDANLGTYEILDLFNCTSVGCSPQSNFIEGPNNELYFLISMPSNAHDIELAKLNATNDSLEKVDDLLLEAGLDLYHPSGDFVYDANLNSFFGVSRYSVGPNSGYGGGFWRYDFSDGRTHSLTAVTNTELTVGSIFVGAFRASDGGIYAVTKAGGTHGKGSIVKLINSSNVIKIADLNDDEALGFGMKSIGSKVFGVYGEGANHNMWTFDLANSNQLTDIIPVSNGDYLQHNFAIHNNSIYTYANNFLNKESGVVLKYDVANQIVTAPQTNINTLGKHVVGSPINSGDSVIYVFTSKGGDNSNGKYDAGTILKYDLSSSTYSKVYNFESDDYFMYKEGNHYIAENGKIYFTVSNNNSTLYAGFGLFELNPVNDNVSLLNNFYVGSPEYTTFIDFHPDLVAYDVNKFAMASRDSVWLYDANNNNITRLKHPTENWLGTNGIAHNGVIYFSCVKDGNNQGTDQTKIISLNVSNNTFGSFFIFENEVDKLSDFSVVDDVLFGSTSSGGVNDDGYLFGIDLNNNQKTILKEFNRSSDGMLFGGWSLFADSLIATSYQGGSNDLGTLVIYDISEGLWTKVKDFELRDGKSFRSSPSVLPPAITSSIGDNEFSKHYLYPNPSDGYFQISEVDYDDIVVLDFSGKEILRSTKKERYKIDNKRGIYFVSLFKGNQMVYNFKLMLK